MFFDYEPRYECSHRRAEEGLVGKVVHIGLILVIIYMWIMTG
ncbi:MAG: hypothetical protein V1845_02385 [bacterium]